MKTIFIDLDGCVFKHPGRLSDITYIESNGILPGVRHRFDEWQSKAYNVIITTGRPEGLRNKTIKQLECHDIVYDQLIMGLKRFPRVLINDIKPDGLESATAINLERDKGMEDLEV